MTEQNNLTLICPFCNSTETLRKGEKNNKQRFQCKICKKYFHEGIKHINPEKTLEILKNDNTYIKVDRKYIFKIENIDKYININFNDENRYLTEDNERIIFTPNHFWINSKYILDCTDAYTIRFYKNELGYKNKNKLNQFQLANDRVIRKFINMYYKCVSIEEQKNELIEVLESEIYEKNLSENIEDSKII
jgi:hypothetical protein